MSERLKDLIAGLILIAVYSASHLLKLDAIIVVRFAALFGVLFHSWILGRRLLPRANGVAQMLFGVILFFGLFSAGLTAWFYVGLPLGAGADLWILTVTMLLCQAVNLILPEQTQGSVPKKNERWDAPRLFFLLATLAITSSSLAYILVGASRAGTTDSIRTPWPLLPPGTLVAVALAWIAVPLSVWLVRSRAFAAIQSGLAIFATTAIVPLVYRLGFGFDGFLHLAGEKQILATGFLNPKPLYYIGQYVFTTWFSRVTDIPIDFVDRWFVPVAIAILIPFVAYLAGDREQSAADRVPTYFFGLFLLPLAPFVATTPQSFAYILGIGALILALGSKDDIAWRAPLILAVWGIAAHPLAGIPMALIVAAILFARGSGTEWINTTRLILSWICVALAGASVPLAFYFLSLNGSTPIIWNMSSLFAAQPWKDLAASITPWIGNTYVVWPAFSTLMTKMLPLLALAASIGTIFLAKKERRITHVVLIAGGVLLFISGTILKTAGDFAFLIDYERGNYAERLYLLGTFCLVVAALPAFGWIIRRARERSSFFSFALIAACGTIAAAQTYTALPRNDALVTGHGWSVGASDMEAVKTIDRDAGKEPYTVLANQSVSAAAVSQFGFNRYSGDVFYYPIPTGGALYETFLRMTYQEPSRDTARDAAKLGGSNLVYVVLNDYWWNADQVGQSLSAIADKEWTIGTADAGLGTSERVYKFDFSTSSAR